MKQLSFFESVPDLSNQTFDYGKGEFKEDEVQEIESHPDPVFDALMSKLEYLNQRAQEDNDLLRSMIDELQEGWTEDEKLQCSDPKEYQRRQKLKEQESEKTEVMAKELTVEAIETLKNCKVEGVVVKIPEGQLDRKIYTEVKNKLELIGGKWKGGKVMGFVYQEDPTELLEEIANGGSRNLKKEFQFFATPDELADDLTALAFIGIDKPETLKILEPSAGQGAIVKAIHRRVGVVKVDFYEAMSVNQIVLRKIPHVLFLGEDFLTASGREYDLIIANPPFSKNQDIDHVMKMWELLKPGGRIVSITSKHWEQSGNKKEKAFRQFLEDSNADIIEVDSGRFKESGTMIASNIIVLNK